MIDKIFVWTKEDIVGYSVMMFLGLSVLFYVYFKNRKNGDT